MSSISASSIVYNNEQWTPAIIEGPKRSISILSDGELTRPTVNHGTISFNIAENREWSDLQWSNAEYEIWCGQNGADFTTFKRIGGGRCGKFKRSGADCDLELLGDDKRVARDLLTATYAGTGGLEGPADLKGNLKPYLAGVVRNASPVLIDATNSIYQVHAYGALASVQGIYENALTMGQSKSDHASYAALVGADLKSGEWATCLAQGLVRLGTEAKGKLTVDATGTATTIRTIVSNLILASGISAANIDANGTLSAFNQTYGLYVTDQLTIGQAIDDAMLSGGGYAFPDQNGLWIAGSYFTPKAPVALSFGELMTGPLVHDEPKLMPVVEPVFRVKIGSERCWSVHSDTEISQALIAPDPITGNLTNEAHTLAASVSGAVTAAEFAKASGTFQLFDGITEMTTTGQVTYAVTSQIGITGSINANGLYSITALPSDSGYMIMTATYGGTTIAKTFAVSKSRAGSDGSAAKLLAISVDRQQVKYDKDGVPSPAVQTITFTARKQNTSAVVNWSLKTIQGQAITPVTSYLSAATGDTVTMTVTQFDAARSGQTGVTITATLTDGPTLTDRMTIARVVDGATGEAGADSISGFLTNEAHNVSTNPDGTVQSFVNAGGTFRVFEGTVEKTSQATFSVFSETGVDVSIDQDGVYQVSSMSAASGTAELRAVYKGITVKKTYSITTSVDGAGFPAAIDQAGKRAEWPNVTGTGRPADNATVGAPVGTPVGGKLAQDVIGAITDSNGSFLPIGSSLAALHIAKDQAATELQTARDNLAAEIARAKGAEGTITTNVTTAQNRADAAHTSIGTETTQRTSADVALGVRIDNVTSTITTEKNTLNSRITTEVAALALADQAIANRTTTLESVSKSIPQYDFSAGIAHMTRDVGGIPALRGSPSNFSEFVDGPSKYLRINITGNSTYQVLKKFDDLPYVAGEVWQIEAEVRTVSGTLMRPLARFYGLDSNGAIVYTGLGTTTPTNPEPTALGEWVKISSELVMDNAATTAKVIRPTFYLQSLNGDSVVANTFVDVKYHVTRRLTEARKNSARIGVEETTRANADSALATRSTTLESQMSGAPSGLKTLLDNKRNNLALADWWKVGASIPWSLNGGKQNRIDSLPAGVWGNLGSPDGGSGDVWLCQADAGGQAAGGWNGGACAPLDPDKTYRFAVPIAPLDAVANRSMYWGVTGVCGLNTTNEYSNAYFAVAGNLTANRWHLFVGYIFPRNSTGKTNAGAGVFDMQTGDQIVGGLNFCFFPDGRQPTHRAYQYYATPDAFQAFGRPLIECVDGSEQPIMQTLAAKRGVTLANARISTEETTRAAQDSALAARASTLEASVNSGTSGNSALSARVAAEEIARASADSAIAGRTTNLEAAASARLADVQNLDTDITNTRARIATEESARANADSALATRASTLEANYTAVNTRITDTSQVLANATEAVAQRASTLEANYNGLSASISTNAGAIAGLNGKTSAFWQVQAVAQNGRAQLKLYADANGGGGVDLVGDLAISGNLLVGGTVTAPKLGFGATGTSSLYSNDNSVTVSSGTFTDVATIALTSQTGQPIRGQFSCFLTDISGPTTQAKVRVIRDDGTVIKFGTNGLIVAARDEGESLSFFFIDSVPAGRNTTWSVQVAKAASHNIRADGLFLMVDEMARNTYQNVTIVAAAGTGPGAGSGGSGGGGGGLGGTVNIQ